VTLAVLPRPNGFGAAIHGIDLSGPLDARTSAALRAAWLAHRVVWFPEQTLRPDTLARFARTLGPFGRDPYVDHLPRHPNVLEVRREPDETVVPFGSSWHSDWSFQPTPPSATLLYAQIIPPVGGDTLFADGCAAHDALTPALRAELDGRFALHSARRPYSREGFAAGRGQDRSMRITPRDDAWAIEAHPIIRTHPETGRRVLWVNAVYAVGIRGMPDRDAQALLARLCAFATREEFVYRHVWQPGMLVIWDNRAVQHCATGGYDGHRRVLHRITIAGDRPR
jgi:taurine dioxygenase